MSNLWFERLFMLVAILAAYKASPALLAVLVFLAAFSALALFLIKGRYLPRFIMDILDRLTDRNSLERAYAARERQVTTIDAEELSIRIKEKVIGQDDVIDAMAAQIRRRLAARRPDKPVAVFCLCGAPGVGKTHLAKVLAKVLYDDGNHLHFFDMSQFAQPHAAATLFGQAKGYVGSTHYGSLTSSLRDVPNAVVLLDEFEKAHPEVHKRFLTAWNDGFITETSDGAKIATDEAIFILTTNAASRRIAELANAHQGDASSLSQLAKSALNDALGDVEAQTALGMYLAAANAGGWEHSFEEAIYWLTKAAEQGLVEPMNMLGMIYLEYARGTPFHNVDKGLAWMQRCANLRHQKCYHALGHIYESGRGVSPDAVQAAVYYKFAKATEPYERMIAQLSESDKSRARVLYSELSKSAASITGIKTKPQEPPSSAESFSSTATKKELR